MNPAEMEFFKMSAAGNDFILFDNRQGTLKQEGLADLVRRVCTRALSVGADGVILLGPSPTADVRATFFNPDGRETFCGNGARCAARLAYLKGMAPARMAVETPVMVHRAEVKGTGVSFEMRDPQGFDDRVEVEVAGERIRGTFVDTGVPHFVVFRPFAESAPIDPLGRALRAHPRFAPDGTNVDFVQPAPGGALSIRTYERGVEGETLACGTGGVAAAIAIASSGMAPSPVALRTRSGATLRVRFEGPPRQARGVRLEGEARLVYVGQLTEEALQGFAPRA
ncbi:MAG: diaminopimelate epimerase [Acidobacteria bacterium]|nr:diaminopimelate epimerase [Acidobacteriota bacterium]